MEVMQDQIYGEILKMRALERWENEGGRAEPHETGRDEATSDGTSREPGSLENKLGRVADVCI